MFRVTNILPIFDPTAVNPSLLKADNRKEVRRKTPDAEPDIVDNLSPPSPGLEMVLEEGRQRKKGSKHSQKYNMGWDVAKEMVEILSLQDDERFRSYLIASKDFVSLLRRGIPEDVQTFLSNPEQYRLLCDDSEVVDLEHSDFNGEDCPNPSEIESVAQSVSHHAPNSENNFPPQGTYHLPPGFREIPARHMSDFTAGCVIKTIKGSGGCLYGSVAYKILNDQDLFKDLRRQAQQFLLRVWDLMNIDGFMTFPMYVTVPGQPDSLKLNSVEDYKSFINTEKSLTSYAESNIEVQNLANFLNITIHSFVYTPTYTNWHSFFPMSNIVGFSEWAFSNNNAVNTVVLYHDFGHHYEIIVERPIPGPSTASVLASPALPSFCPTSDGPSRFVAPAPPQRVPLIPPSHTLWSAPTSPCSQVRTHVTPPSPPCIPTPTNYSRSAVTSPSSSVRASYTSTAMQRALSIFQPILPGHPM